MRNIREANNPYSDDKDIDGGFATLMVYIIFNSVVGYSSYPSFYKRKGENTK